MELNAFISRSQEKGSGDAVAVKDLVDVEGMVTTAGGIILPNVPAEHDAPVVARIRQAGCVVAGKANLKESPVEPPSGPAPAEPRATPASPATAPRQTAAQINAFGLLVHLIRVRLQRLFGRAS